MITFEEFQVQCYRAYNDRPGHQHSLRFGQFCVGELHKIRPDLARDLRNQDHDPYYSNERLPAFWAWLETSWGKQP